MYVVNSYKILNIDIDIKFDHIEPLLKRGALQHSNAKLLFKLWTLRTIQYPISHSLCRPLILQFPKIQGKLKGYTVIALLPFLRGEMVRLA